MLELHSYWRSSAAYRVRCALNLKKLPYDIVPVHLVRDGGQQHSARYRALNPQGLVPTLVDDDFALTQSLAIFQYLEELHPTPALVPSDRRLRARQWAFCNAIACELQPMQNLRVLNYLSGPLQLSEEQKAEWLRHWITEGMAALAKLLPAKEFAYSFADTPTYADCCLAPQAFACERFGIALEAWPRLAAIVERLRALPEIAAAHPSVHPDALPN